MEGDTPGTLGLSSPRGRSRIRSVTLDGIEVRRTSADALKLAGVREGDALSLAELEGLLDESEPGAAMNRALRLLGHRERSDAELGSRLGDDGYPERVVAQVLARLSDYGYLDDNRFAEDYVRSKRAAGWGRRRISRGLAEKGVAEDTAAAALDASLPESGEFERACAVVSGVDVSTPAGAARALRRLVGRGFDYDVARRVIDRQRGCGDEHADDL